MTKVGFELELSGSDKGITFNPTCRECSEIHWALEAIASWILDQRDVELTLELRHRDQSISYSGAAQKPSRRHPGNQHPPSFWFLWSGGPTWNPLFGKDENATSTAGYMRAPMDSQFISSDGSASSSL